MASINWLHFTDLHIGQRGHPILWPNVREDVTKDLAKLHQLCGPWDIVFFTGDLTFSGNAAEFVALSEELAKLWEVMNRLGSNPVLLTVPGNHDLLRQKAENPSVQFLAESFRHPEFETAFWNDPAHAGVVHDAFAPYEAWWKSHSFRGDLKPTAGALPGDFSVTIERFGARLGVVGLNTAFVQLTDAKGAKFDGRLHVSLRQFHQACPDKDGAKWTAEHDACFLLTHHPVEWLSNSARRVFNGEIARPGRFALHLFGHLHQSVSETRTVNGADAIRSWQGVSLFGLEGFGKKNESRALGFSGGRLIFDGERARLQRWPRVGVKHRNEQWRVVPDWNFDLQERESRTADDVFALARKVETLPQEVESAVRNWSRQEHLEERLGTLEKAIKTLLRELRNTQSTYGPFGVFLGSPDSPPDPWTQAQCTSALLIGAEPLVNVRGAFDYIHQSRRKQAWPRTPEEPLLSIEATAHAGLVVLRGLRAIRTGSDLDENTLRESLDVAYAYVRAEQKPSLNPGEGGSWASLSQDGTGERPAAEVATYSALRFLLEYRREGLRPNEVEGRIQRGLNWIQAGYQGDIRGWKDQERTAPQRDIALLFLTVAALAQETERPTFKGGNGLWIDALRKLFTTALRDTGFEAGVPRTIMQPQGRWMFSPVQIAWYPLLLSLALRTGTRDWLPLADRALSLRVVDMLWEQLSSYVKEVTTNDAPTYLVADAALALLEGREALAKLVSKSTGEASVALSP